jgi:hypothetical protein
MQDDKTETFYRIRRKSDGQFYNMFGEWGEACRAERWRELRPVQRTIEWQLSEVADGVEIVRFEAREVGVVS